MQFDLWDSHATTQVAPARAQRLDSLRPGASQAIHVAILDDHVVVRFGIETLIRRNDRMRWTGAAENSAGLFKLLSSAPCHVLVLDYELSPDELDGWSLVRIVRARFPHVRIIVYTSHVEAATETLMRQAGAHGFLSKSSDLDELLRMIDHVASGRTYFSAAPPATAGAAHLTPRETEVLRCCMQGLSMTDIARKFERSVKTVSSQNRASLLSGYRRYYDETPSATRMRRP